MAISVDICNLALGEVRAAFITSSNDNTPEARACNRFYPMCLQSLLEAHEWSYATNLTQLARMTTNIRSTQWSYAYALPSDIAIARRLIPSRSYVVGTFYPSSRHFAHENDFVIESQVLYTNAAPAILEYVRNDIDPSVMPAVFKKALSLDIASYLATYLLNDSKLKGELIQQAEVAKQRAMAADINRQPGGEFRHWVAPVQGTPFGLEGTTPTTTTTPSVGALPANLSLPIITGSAQVGQLLSCSTGSWSG